MSDSTNENFIPYSSMKEQIEGEIQALLENKKNTEEIEIPRISFERGNTNIYFPIPYLDERILVKFINIMNIHLDNIRIHSFERGLYAFQALNENIFKTENILDNLKIQVMGLIERFNIEISKKGNFTQEEINLTIEIFKAAYFSDSRSDPFVRLKAFGASVLSTEVSLDWTCIAGYEEVKRNVKESIILPLKNPEIYDSIAEMTRARFESNRPHAILFEGAPGVGKTTIARIISGRVDLPLIYIPIESIMSKWYGESPRNLSQIFDIAEEIGGAILFFDEIDSLAGSRDQNMFEATRRVLSVLLRRLDGIDSVINTLIIGATNRKSDLDHALLSRFDQTIHFPLPNLRERASIFSTYAAHLNEGELEALARVCDGISGRNIKDICEFAERRWARRLIIKKLSASVPPYEYYTQALRLWINDRGDEKLICQTGNG
ncbi:MAG: ATP-binding protein [Spirochaetota bacterium]|nr:ATP-binding protein [Spirochaetota bacterium]